MAKKSKKKPKTVKIKEPLRDRELPVTKRYLDLKIHEVKGDVTSLRLDMKAGFTAIDSKFSSMESKFSGIDSKFSSMESKFSNIDSKFSSIDSKFLAVDARFEEQNAKFAMIDTKLTKMLVLLEDQNDRNRATLDANTVVYERITENDSRVEKLEECVFGIRQK